MTLAAIFHMSPKAVSYQDHQDSLHPSVFVLVQLLWEQNMGFFQDLPVAYRVTWVPKQSKRFLKSMQYNNLSQNYSCSAFGMPTSTVRVEKTFHM